MKRIQVAFLFLFLIGAIIVSLISSTTHPTEAHPLYGHQIVAVSVFSGQGNTNNVDTGLRYNGVAVSPTFVQIQVYGFQTVGKTGYHPHQADTRIDVYVDSGQPWTGLAYYIV